VLNLILSSTSDVLANDISPSGHSYRGQALMTSRWQRGQFGFRDVESWHRVKFRLIHSPSSRARRPPAASLPCWQRQQSLLAEKSAEAHLLLLLLLPLPLALLPLLFLLLGGSGSIFLEKGEHADFVVTASGIALVTGQSLFT
jgi:hypothetical protein